MAELPAVGRPLPVVWTGARIAEWQRSGIRPTVAVWTPAQTAAYLNAARGERLYPAFHLIALRGLRRGEAAGLRGQQELQPRHRPDANKQPHRGDRGLPFQERRASDVDQSGAARAAVQCPRPTLGLGYRAESQR